MKPLILIVNDDGYNIPGLDALIGVAKDYGELVVMVPEANASAQSHSLTVLRPLRVHKAAEESWGVAYTCDGTPVDCVKMALDHFCPRRPGLVLSGINHGSNASINAHYSATVGGAMEATLCGYPSIAFSLTDHKMSADFGPGLKYVRYVIDNVLANGLPHGIMLNVNIPAGELKGMMVCRQSDACWVESFEKRVDPHGEPYYWLTGRFECNDKGEGTDMYALDNGYVSIVPTTSDMTGEWKMENLESLAESAENRLNE